MDLAVTCAVATQPRRVLRMQPRLATNSPAGGLSGAGAFALALPQHLQPLLCTDLGRADAAQAARHAHLCDHDTRVCMPAPVS